MVFICNKANWYLSIKKFCISLSLHFKKSLFSSIPKVSKRFWSLDQSALILREFPVIGFLKGLPENRLLLCFRSRSVKAFIAKLSMERFLKRIGIVVFRLQLFSKKRRQKKGVFFNWWIVTSLKIKEWYHEENDCGWQILGKFAPSCVERCFLRPWSV